MTRRTPGSNELAYLSPIGDPDQPPAWLGALRIYPNAPWMVEARRRRRREAMAPGEARPGAAMAGAVDDATRHGPPAGPHSTQRLIP
jgi:hypothetical protein